MKRSIDAQRRTLLAALGAGGRGEVQAAEFVLGGRLLAASYATGNVVVWGVPDEETGRRRQSKGSTAKVGLRSTGCRMGG